MNIEFYKAYIGRYDVYHTFLSTTIFVCSSAYMKFVSTQTYYDNTQEAIHSLKCTHLLLLFCRHLTANTVADNSAMYCIGVPARVRVHYLCVRR
jgi:hypothetical protein